MTENQTIRASYRDYFEIDQPFNGLEIEFVARWIHGNHNFSELRQTPAMKWNVRWNLPPVALANFYTFFTDAFTGNPGALIATVWQTNVPSLPVVETTGKGCASPSGLKSVRKTNANESRIKTKRLNCDLSHSPDAAMHVLCSDTTGVPADK